jgi:GrpB-like predicted nucleotidyltransferase (UPF0157 family)
VHACALPGAFWDEHVIFRDRLRADRGLARDYEALKRDLAARFATDRVAYGEAKGPFIERVLARA